MCQLGDVIQILDPTNENIKYKLCLRVPTDSLAGCFSYLNSQDNRNNSFVIDATRIEFLPHGRAEKPVSAFRTCRVITKAN